MALFVALVIVAGVVIYCFLQHKRRKQESAAKESFDNTIVTEHVDGSVVATNRLHGLVHTPELSRVQYANINDSSDGINAVTFAYNNPEYSRGGEREPVTNDVSPVGGAKKTVINVSSNPYDSIKYTPEGELHESGNEHAGERTYDNIRRDDANSVSSDDHFYMTMLSEQPEVTPTPMVETHPGEFTGSGEMTP